MAGSVGMNVGANDLEDLARRLRSQSGGRAQRRYQQAIQSAVPPIEAALRSAALGARVTSSRGGRSPRAEGSNSRRRQGPLRQRVAGAIDHRVTPTGVRFVVDAAKVDSRYGGTLPRYLDGELPKSRRWRHPVFGNAEVWAQQTGTPWFFRTIRRHEETVEKAIGQAMDDIAGELT